MRKLLSLLGALLIMTASSTATAFSLTSSAFSDQTSIPKQYTCDGQDVSPELSWSNVPANTKSLALIVADPDAPRGTFYHWILYNIPTTLSKISAGELINDAKLGKNDFEKLQYNGPCPPKGPTHHYIFSLYALDTMISLLTEPVTAESLLAAMKGHVLAKAELTGLYTRP